METPHGDGSAADRRRLIPILALALGACAPKAPPVSPLPPPPTTVAAPSPAPSPSAAPEARPVAKAKEEVIVSAWAEPKVLPPGGGEAGIRVSLRKRGGRPYPNVEVRVEASSGRLASGGQILLTDDAGVARDRLQTRRGARITVNAGGTFYRFEVPVQVPEPSPEPSPSPSPSESPSPP